MALYALVATNGHICQIDAATFPVAPPMVWTGDISAVVPAPQVGWPAAETNGAWTFTGPPAPPTPTLAALATAALSAGLGITLSGTLTLAETVFPVDATTQTKLNTMVNELNTSGTFFGATTGLMKDAATPPVWHPFTAAQYKIVASAIGAYVAALDMIIDGNPLNATSLPKSSVSLTV